MYSCDMESLHTSIPTDLGLEAIEYWIMRKRDFIPQRFTKEFIPESIELILKNKFLFDSKMFSRLIGTAMGTKCAPLCAWVFKKKLNIVTTICYQEETKYSYQNIFPIKSVY